MYASKLVSLIFVFLAVWMGVSHVLIGLTDIGGYRSIKTKSIALIVLILFLVLMRISIFLMMGE